MIDNSKNPLNCCKFCGWKFSPDIVQRISDNNAPVFCEFCGIEITVSSINIQEKLNKKDSLKSTHKDGDTEKKKNSIVKNISKRIQPTKYSVSIISGDENFPKIFKENLIIVISRLIYSFIKEWEHENNVSVSRVSLEKKILNYFRERISPILEKRVHEKFLRNLFKINREDFEHWLKLLQEKLALDQDYNAHFKVFLTWVIKIVFRLVSEMWDMKNLPKLHATILKDLKNYNLGFYNLKDNQENKKISRTKSEKMSIRAFKKEYKIINDIYKGRFNGKCANPECNVDFRKLPALGFHHNNPNIKTIGWNDLMHKKYRIIKKELEQQDIRVLCNNCHSLQNSKIFNDFKDLIMKKDLFTQSAKEVDEIMEKEIICYLKKTRIKKSGPYLKFEIKRWIKKRIIIEQLFNGGCIACGEKSLPVLQCHHTNPELKMNKWSVISRKWDTKKLIEDFFLKEQCIILCANCHMMIKASNFKNNIKIILGSKYNREILAEYKKLEDNIKIFTLKIRRLRDHLDTIKLKDPLKLMIPKGDSWKKVLIHAFYITQEKGINEVNINELSYSLNVSKKVVRVDLLPILLKVNLLEFKKKKGNAFLYNLTEKGQKSALFNIKDLSISYPNEFINLLKNIKIQLKNSRL